MQPLDILVVAPHPDDAEISVGGIIAVSLRQNLRVGVVELTSGEPTPHGSVEIRRLETQKATELLGLTWRTNLDLPNRSLQPTLEARRKLAEVFSICPASDHSRPALAGRSPGSCRGRQPV